MTPYQIVLTYYIQLQRAYKWTPAEIDALEVELMIDQLEVLIEDNDGVESAAYIDEIMGF